MLDYFLSQHPGSGVARLGHMPQQLEAVPHRCRYAYELSALIVSLSIVNQALNGLEIERCSICISTEFEPHKFAAYADRACPRPPKCFCTLHRISYKRSMPMLCTSISDVLATPLHPWKPFLHIFMLLYYVWTWYLIG